MLGLADVGLLGGVLFKTFNAFPPAIASCQDASRPLYGAHRLEPNRFLGWVRVLVSPAPPPLLFYADLCCSLPCPLLRRVESQAPAPDAGMA